VKQQSSAHQRLMHAFESFDMNVSDPHLGAGGHVKAQIQHWGVGCLVGNRRIDLRKGVALFLEGREQTCTPGQHAGGNRGLTGR